MVDYAFVHMTILLVFTSRSDIVMNVFKTLRSSNQMAQAMKGVAKV